MRFLLTLGLTIALAFNSWAGVTIKGTILNANGKAPAKAHVHLVTFGGNEFAPIKSVETDSKGAFTITNDKEMFYTLYITAANHKAKKIDILTSALDKTATIEVVLDANKVKFNPQKTMAVGDWNNTRFRSPEKLVEQSDGTYLAIIKTDAAEVAYQLSNYALNGHTVNGTNHTSLLYDDGGDYKSIVKVVNGEARIVFDPTKAFKDNGDTPSYVKIKEQNLNNIAAISTLFEAHVTEFNVARSAFNKKNKSLDGFKFNFTTVQNLLENKMKSGTKMAKRYAAVCYASLMELGAEELNTKRITKLLPVTDILWAKAPRALLSAYSDAHGKDKANEIIAKQFEKIPSNNVRAHLLVSQGMEALDKADISALDRIYKKLMDNPATKSSGLLKYYASMFDTNKAIMVGKPAPEFEVTLLDGNKKVSKSSMKGKYYLMDFWAVWCGPCRAEMPTLHKVYEKFKSDKFEILSLSFDRKKSAIAQYRKKDWKMPWLHTFVEGGFKNPMSKRFEVSGIPKPILIDPQGNIIASGVSLRGENLEKTLAKHLK